MNEVVAEHSTEESSLRQQVEQSRSELEQLRRQLRAVDEQIGKLQQVQHRYEVLSRARAALEELDSLGCAELFWDLQADPQAPKTHLAVARARHEAFAARFGKVREMRQSIVAKIEAHSGDLDDLQYELQHVLDQEQRRRNDWVIEREPDKLPFRAQVMPWARGFEEDLRFRRSLLGSMVTALAVAGILSSIALPVMERPEVPPVPKRVAKLVLERPVPIPEPEVPLAEPKVAEQLAPKPKPVQPVKPTKPKRESKPQVAASPGPVKPKRPTGILAFRDSLAKSRERPSTLLGADARLRAGGDQATGRPQRAMVTTQGPGSSGGINLADISRDIGGGGGGGGGGLDGVAVSRVSSSIGGGGGSDRPLSRGASAGRTDEEIQIVFDRYKAALYRMYNRELRRDPTLRGQIVLRLTIEPNGSVSLCQLHNSDMDAPALAQRIVERVSTFDFGAKPDIAAITIVYPIDFVPSA